METTLENITNELQKIGWSVIPNGNEIECYYIKNHRDEYVDVEIWFPKTDGRIEFTTKDYSHPKVVFYLKSTVIDELGGGTGFSIRGKENKDIFILFANYDKK